MYFPFVPKSEIVIIACLRNDNRGNNLRIVHIIVLIKETGCCKHNRLFEKYEAFCMVYMYKYFSLNLKVFFCY